MSDNTIPEYLQQELPPVRLKTQSYSLRLE